MVSWHVACEGCYAKCGYNGPVHCKADFLFCAREFDSARTLSLTLVGHDMKSTIFSEDAITVS